MFHAVSAHSKIILQQQQARLLRPMPLCLQVEGAPAASSPEAGTELEQLHRQVGALQLALQGAQAAHGQALERMATMKVGLRFCTSH